MISLGQSPHNKLPQPPKNAFAFLFRLVVVKCFQRLSSGQIFLQIIFRIIIFPLLAGITLLSCSSESTTGNDEVPQKTNDILVDRMTSAGTIALFESELPEMYSTE